MSTVDPVPLVDEGPGNSADLLDLADGRAFVVDVSLDLRGAWQTTRRHGLQLAFAADTRLPAELPSGARQSAAIDRAELTGRSPKDGS